VKKQLALVIGNELLMCDKLSDTIAEMVPGIELHQMEYVQAITDYVIECAEAGLYFDYIFLDGRDSSLTEKSTAGKMKQYMPETKIILCPVFADEYPVVSKWFIDGIVLYPLSAGAVYRTMGNTECADETEKTVRGPEVRVHTFGNFDVFVNGKPLAFERKKAKELFAYLIDRKGAGASTSEIASVLWEDRKYDSGIRSQTTRTISVMRKALIQNGIGDVLVKSWNSLAVDPDKLICDAYAFEKGEGWAVNSYRGEYMKNYSWAEVTNGKMQKNTV